MVQEKVVIGIDPGTMSGVVFLNLLRPTVHGFKVFQQGGARDQDRAAHAMEMAKYIKSMTEYLEVEAIVIETPVVTPVSRGTVVRQGEGIGALKLAIIAIGYQDFHEVPPTKVKHSLGLKGNPTKRSMLIRVRQTIHPLEGTKDDAMRFRFNMHSNAKQETLSDAIHIAATYCNYEGLPDPIDTQQIKRKTPRRK